MGDGPTVTTSILVLCPFPCGVAAGQRLKYEQYFDDWAAAGYTVTVSPFMDTAMWREAYRPGRLWGKAIGFLRGQIRRYRDLRRIAEYDLVYLFMWGTPVGTASYERTVRRKAKRLVYDLEDNILSGHAIKGGDSPNGLLRLLKGRGKVQYLVRTADHVITSSPLLNEQCLEINEALACTYISSSVNTERFLPVNTYRNERPLTIGWTGTFSSRPYLDLLRPVFVELTRQRRFKLRVIGNFEYEIRGVDLEVLQWSVEREVEQLQGIDIGVYPLPVDDWVGGKSGLKAIQYMAFGLPCVATNVGTTPRIIRDGDNGLLVESEAQWLAALVRLIDEPALRRRLGEQARRDAVTNYSLKAVAADYRRVLANVTRNEYDS